MQTCLVSTTSCSNRVIFTFLFGNQWQNKTLFFHIVFLAYSKETIYGYIFFRNSVSALGLQKEGGKSTVRREGNILEIVEIHFFLDQNFNIEVFVVFIKSTKFFE